MGSKYKQGDKVKVDIMKYIEGGNEYTYRRRKYHENDGERVEWTREDGIRPPTAIIQILEEAFISLEDPSKLETTVVHLKIDQNTK